MLDKTNLQSVIVNPVEFKFRVVLKALQNKDIFLPWNKGQVWSKVPKYIRSVTLG